MTHDLEQTGQTHNSIKISQTSKLHHPISRLVFLLYLEIYWFDEVLSIIHIPRTNISQKGSRIENFFKLRRELAILSINYYIQLSALPHREIRIPFGSDWAAHPEGVAGYTPLHDSWYCTCTFTRACSLVFRWVVSACEGFERSEITYNFFQAASYTHAHFFGQNSSTQNHNVKSHQNP